MTSTLATFPTPETISERVAEIYPAPQRHRELYDLVMRAQHLAAVPTDQLGELLRAAREDGIMPTSQQIADAALAVDERRRAELAVDTLQVWRRDHAAPDEMTPRVADEVLAYLGREALPPVLSAVRELPVAPVLTADAALESDDSREQYLRIRQIVASYHAIRQQQKTALHAHSRYLAADAVAIAPGTSTAYAKNPSEWAPSFLAQRSAIGKQYGPWLERNGTPEARAYFTEVPAAPFAPIKTGEVWPADCDDFESRARHLIKATRELELWVPTNAEMMEHHEAEMKRIKLDTWTKQNGPTVLRR